MGILSVGLNIKEDDSWVEFVVEKPTVFRVRVNSKMNRNQVALIIEAGQEVKVNRKPKYERISHEDSISCNRL